MSTPLPGRRLSELPFSASPIGAEIYGNKDGLPVRVKVGNALGLTTLDAAGLVPAAQVPGGAAALRGDLASTVAGKGGELAGHISDKTDAVATNVKRKLRNLDLDWEDFGIVADGIADDSLAFERALTAANGRRLILPEGTTAAPRIIRLTRVLSTFTGGIAPMLLGGGPDKTRVRVDAASFATDLIVFVGAPRGIKMHGICFDQNGATTATAVGMLGFQNPEDIEIAFCEFINFDKIGMAMNGARYFDVRNNRFTRATASTAYNQAFLLGSSSQPSKEGRFSHNTCLRSGTDFDGANIEIDNNDISGWSFGAGVTTEQSASSYRYTIRDNKCYGSTGTDVNGYKPGGIENWGSYSVITGNSCYSNSGAGMDQGGQYSYVAGNFCYNNGTSGAPGVVAGGDGIVSRYGSVTYNANYSTYVGNTCYDAQVSKTQGYGYADQSASLNGITHRGNKYGAHLTGTENILASVTDRDAPTFELSFVTDPISLANGTQAGYAQTFSGAALGDFVQVSFSNSLAGINLWGYVTAANAINYFFDNNAGGTIDLASGTVRVRITKPKGYVAMF